MSNEDSFINEVTEEVRQDQLFRTLKKYGWIGIVVVVVLVGGASWSEFSKARSEAAAAKLGDAVLSALETDDSAEAAILLANVESQGAVGAIIALLESAELEDSGDLSAASAVLDQVATDADMPQVYRDIALFKSLLLDVDADGSSRKSGFSALTEPGNPMRLLATEQMAMIDAESGDTEAALGQFAMILEDSEATRGLRRRARGMIVALGGDIEALFNGVPANDG